MDAHGVDMFSRICSMASLSTSFAAVLRRGGGPGIDRVTVEQWASDFQARLEDLHRRLATNDYKPSPGVRIELADDPERKISVPTVTDRIVQKSVALALTPFYERRFNHVSFAYRPGRGLGHASRFVQRSIQEGFHTFARVDIVKFFDSIDDAKLIEQLSEDGVEQAVVRLTRRLVRQGSLDESVLRFEGGLMQGSCLSPLLSNVYLRGVDHALAQAGFPCARYGDDVLILGVSEEQVRDALGLLTEQLGTLGLVLNLRKQRIGRLEHGFQFLGVRYDHRGATVTRRAHAGLTHRADALLQARRVEHLDELLDQWARWYDPLGAADIDSPGLLAAHLRASLDERPTLPAHALARRRLELHDAQNHWPLVSHAQLLELWIELSRHGALDELVSRALVIELLATLSHPSADDTTRRSVERALVIDDGALQQVWQLDALIGALARQGRVGLADTARRMLRASAPQPDQAEVDPDDAVVVRLHQLFDTHRGRHLVEREDHRGHVRLQIDQSRLTERDVRDHLRGRRRRGAYVLTHDFQVRFAQLSVQISRDVIKRQWGLGALDARSDARRQWRYRLEQHALAMLAACARHDLRPLVERVGDSGVRLWFFFEEPVTLRLARDLLAHVLRAAPPLPEGMSQMCIPNVDHVRKPPGPFVVLPLGKDPRASRPSAFVDHDLKPLEPARALHLIAMHPASVLSRSRRPGPLSDRGRAQRTEDAIAQLQGLDRACATLRGCGMLAQLVRKARELGYLEGIERATLYEALGFLTGDDRVEVMTKILEPTGGVRRAQVQKRLQTLADSPIGCAKIRTRHQKLLQECPCDCKFVVPRGAYPTPTLHAQRAEQIAVFAARARRPARHHNARHQKSRPTRSARSVAPAAPKEVTMIEQPEPQHPAIHQPMPGTPQVAVDDPRAEVEALVTEFARAKRQVEKATEKL